jgi:uncharacterized protein YlxW (UPF0749 family)
VTRRTLAYALLLLFMGLWIGLATRSELLYTSALSYRRYLAMVSLIGAAERRNAALRQELLTLRRDSPRQVAESTFARLRAELRAARAAAGETPVEGEGLRIWLSDAPVLLAQGTDQEAYLVHDIDLLLLVDALNAAGAKAVSVNGIRIGATTQIRCAGPVISIGRVRTAPPITVLAVGPPERLKAAAEARDGILRRMEVYGIPVRVEVARVTVPPLAPGAR